MSLEISLHLLTLPFLTSTIVIYLTSLFLIKSEDEEGEGVNISGYFIMLAFTFIIISVLALPFF